MSSQQFMTQKPCALLIAELGYRNVSRSSVSLQSNLPNVLVALPLPPPQPTYLQIVISSNSPKPQADFFLIWSACDAPPALPQRKIPTWQSRSICFDLGFIDPRSSFLYFIHCIVIINAEDMSSNPPPIVLADLLCLGHRRGTSFIVTASLTLRSTTIRLKAVR